MRPTSIGAHIPTKIPCNLSPLKNKYSETMMINTQSISNSILVIPKSLKNFIKALFYEYKNKKKCA